MANLIVAQQARKQIEIGFMEYFRAGALITALSIAVGILVLAIEVKMDLRIPERAGPVGRAAGPEMYLGVDDFHEVRSFLCCGRIVPR